MKTSEQLSNEGFVNPVVIDPPPNAIARLSKALDKAVNEGRGTKTINNLADSLTFFNADSPFPGTRNTQTYAYFESPSGGPALVSGYETWRPQGPANEPGIELNDCYAVANEINALK